MPALWRRARLAERPGAGGETAAVLGRLLGERGSLLDVGAGTGRVSRPFAAAGHRVTAVAHGEAMAEGFRAEAAELGVEARLIEGEWPAAAADAGPHDVAVCANAVYDVADIGPFLAALEAAARRAVVIELTEEHPWSHLRPYFRALHGHELPDRPVLADFLEVVDEVTGHTREVRRWTRAGVHHFADLQELLAFYGRRLLVPPEWADELLEILAPDIGHHEGWLTLGDLERPTATVWWATA